MLKQGALPTLNLPRKDASNITNLCPAKAVQKHEKHQLLQEEMPQPAQDATCFQFTKYFLFTNHVVESLCQKQRNKSVL